MKFMLIGLILFPSLSFATAVSKSCLANLVSLEARFASGDVYDIVPCPQTSGGRGSCQNIGQMNPSDRSLSIPFNNNGRRGLMYYSGGSSKFVPFPNQGMRVNETRKISFMNGRQRVCGTFKRSYGVDWGTHTTIGGIAANLEERYDGSSIGYEFKYLPAANCQNVPVTAAFDLISDQTERLLVSGIERQAHDMSSNALRSDITRSGTSTIVEDVDCRRRGGNWQACHLSMREKIEATISTMVTCQNTATDPHLRAYLLRKINEMKNQAYAVGMFPRPGSPAASGTRVGRQ